MSSTMLRLSLVILFSSAALGTEQVVRRVTTEETSVFMTQSAIDSLEQKIVQKATENFAQQSVNAVAAAVKTSIDTSFAFVQPLMNRTDTVAAQVRALETTVTQMQSDVESGLQTKVNEVMDDINDQVNQIKTQTDNQISSSLKSMNDTLKSVSASIGKVLTNADTLACNGGTKGTLRLRGSKMEACDGSSWKGVGGGGKYNYIQWGNNVCSGLNKGVKQLYSGYTWGGYHDHRGGADPVCLRSGGGYNGGKNDGDDSANLLYPLRTEGPGPSNGAVNPGYLIRCAKCVVERNCYLEIGLNSCGSSDYEPMYSGSTYGGYHGHVSNNARICLDRAGRYDNGGSHGAYMYPSKTKTTFDGRNSEAFLKCHVCCEK